MPKNTDFFKLDPYSRKNSIRTGTGIKIGQTESNRAKLAVPRALTHQQRAGSAWSCAREGARRRLYARPLPRSRGSAGPVGSARVAVRHGLQATRVDASLELCCSSRWSTSVWCLSQPSAAHRHPFFFLFSFSFFSALWKLKHSPLFRFSYLSICRSDRHDSFGKVLDRVTGYVLVFFFCNFCLTTRWVKSVESSLTVLRRFSGSCLRIEVSAKLLQRSCRELFLNEYIKILDLDSQRKNRRSKKMFKILPRGFLWFLDGKWDSGHPHSLFPPKKGSLHHVLD